MIEWINNRFNKNFSAEEVKHITDFALIWNTFERYVCNTHFSIALTEKSIAPKNLDIVEFQEFLDYFKNRCIENGVINQRFTHLNFRQNDREEFVRDVLLGATNEIHKIVLALIIIVNRYRNNLFHGLKDIQVINEQNENFRIANRVMTTVLNHF